ncbi:putative nitrate reductase molybdenum cofactor assembly chaperone NarJ [Nocardia nova SH22a]|uniref:Putative nitrate reductase molybdenum cofactor assembly chaperone NarJ n=1 Tax=Nocardia nova SH22a TaxID=1415166 RepID=W5TNH5_9NOCA|nr:nitrate reductase molybdenum cofactor assembly chaperone [Nocardia nova]AHH18796.1 putative nitrate reductase molybdenum cofactor assembly chaperone NarJ [Nocardia nova SH22a]
MIRTETRRAAWQMQSLLLSYPDAALLNSLPMLTRVAHALPLALGAPVRPLLSHLSGSPPVRLASEYVDTFDHRKRFSPYLTYFTDGDTRKRGMALLRLKQLYRGAGWQLDDGELPDHLAVVLEFAATEPESGLRVLTDYRAGVEVMRAALRESRSLWAGVLDSVSQTLPPLRGSDSDAVARLIAAGPPGEEVGTEPFAPPTYMTTPIGGRR